MIEEEELWEEMVGGGRVPWVMWIQVVVLLLLLIIIIIFLLDLPSSSADSSSALVVFPPTRFHSAKLEEVRESVNNAAGTGTSKRRVRRVDIHEKEGDAPQIPIFERSYHPCHYFGLAKQAFLKCLGLDFTSKDSSPNNMRQEKEQ